MKRQSYKIINDLYSLLPKIRTWLGDPSADLAILYSEFFSWKYMAFEEHRDKAVAKYGALEGLPYINVRKEYMEAREFGWGVTIYQANPLLKYAIFSMPDVSDFGNEFMCCILPEKHKRAFLDHTTQQQIKSKRLTKAPVLKEGLLEDIVENTIGFLENAQEIEKYGVRIVRGVILEGKPGNGKTMVCKWINKLCLEQQNITCGNVTSSQIEDYYARGMLHDLFSRYDVTFFDDFDTEMIEGRYGKDILTAMDGIDDTSHRIRIFTTNNKVRKIDSAFFRPGRVDSVFEIGFPDREMRRRLVSNTWNKEILGYLNEPKQMKFFLDKTDGMSFADIESVKAIMVKQRVMSGLPWNQNEAFRIFEEKHNLKSRRVGFN